MDGGVMTEKIEAIETVEPKKLSNFRRNRLGGIDADRELDSGEIVPYTLTEDEYDQAADVADYDGTEIERKARLERAKSTRDKAIESNLVVLDAEWQVDAISRDRMNLTINIAALQNHPPETTVPWRVADNSYRDTTAADLSAVLAAYAQRMAVIFQAFSAWEDSNTTDEFTL